MKNKAIASAEVHIDVPFHDVDSMGIVWHGHYAKYFEIARCALLDRLGYNYNQMLESGFGWPVIDMRIRYAQPLRFEQKIKVRADLVEYENRLKIDYQVLDAQSGKRLTKGYSVQVAVDISNGEMLFASPPVVAEKIREYQASC